MARRVPREFVDKLHAVLAEVDRARGEALSDFLVTHEVLPNVRLVKTRALDTPVVFSLWTLDTDVVELCGDAAYPATAGLLAIDKEEIAELERKGVVVDRSFLTRSESVPGVYYALFDYLSNRQLRQVLGRLVPAQGDTT